MSPQRNHNRARQRRRIDQVRRAQLLRVGDAVGQYKPPFRIGIDHVDGFSRHRRHHIARLVGLAVRHVFGGADNRHYPHLRPEQRNGAHGAQHGRRSRHVVLHQFHLLGRLDGDAAGVERNSLAHQASSGPSFTPSGS